MKSDADHSNWRIRSCVGTDRDDKGRQLQQTSLTLGKAMIALRIKGRQSLCRQSALPRPIQGGDHQRRWRLLAITFTVIIRQTGNTPGANNSKLQKEGDNRHSGQHQRLTFSKGKEGRMGGLPTPRTSLSASSHIVEVGRLCWYSLLLTAARGLRGWTERKTA